MKKTNILKLAFILFSFVFIINTKDVYGVVGKEVWSFADLKEGLTSAGDYDLHIKADIPVTETIYCSSSGRKIIFGFGHTIWNYLDTAGNVKPNSSNTCIEIPQGVTVYLNNVNFNGRYASNMISSTNGSTNVIIRGICYIQNNCNFVNGNQGIHVYTTGTCHFESGNSTSEGNFTGIGNLGTVNLKGGTISGSSEGIHNNGGTVNITAGTIKGKNKTKTGINNFNNGTINITGSGVKITDWADGILNYGTLKITNGSVYGNQNGIVNGKNTTISGGNIYSNTIGIKNTSSLTVSGGTIRDNTAVYGSAIYQNGTCTIIGGTFPSDQNVYLAADDKFVSTNTAHPTFTIKPNTYTRGRVLVKTSGESYATNELSYLTLVPSDKWQTRALTSNIVIWDKSNVTVKYVDELGNELADSDIINNWVDENYTTSPKTISDYGVYTIPENASGKVESTDTEVVYVYKKISPGVDVKYIDEDTGKEIEPTIHIDGFENDDYTTESKKIDGYELKSIPENSSGKMTLEKIEVVYLYSSVKGKITIIKVDKNDNTKLLSGAIFKLEKLDSEGNIDVTFNPIEKITDKNGKIEFTELKLGRYKVTEIKAPEGYELPKNAVEIEITSEENQFNIESSDKLKIELPETGGKGIVIYITAGLILMITAILIKKWH